MAVQSGLRHYRRCYHTEVPNLVSKEAGQRIIDRRENQGFVDDDLSFPCSPKEETESSLLNPSELTTIDEAIQDFLLDMEYRHLEESTIRTYRPLFNELRLFCESAGIQYLFKINLDQTRRFRRSWKLGDKRAGN